MSPEDINAVKCWIDTKSNINVGSIGVCQSSLANDQGVRGAGGGGGRYLTFRRLTKGIF